MSIQIEKYYALRIDLIVPIENILQLIQKHSNVYMYCIEGEHTNNPHCQAYLETISNPKTIRENIRKLGLKGNASYSLKELDDIKPLEYLGYLTKEKKYKMIGFTEEEIKQVEEYEVKKKKEIKEKKEDAKRWMPKFKSYLIDKRAQKEEQFEHYELKDWTQFLIEWYRDEEKLYREFQIVSQVQTLYLKYHVYAVKHLTMSILSKIGS